MNNPKICVIPYCGRKAHDHGHGKLGTYCSKHQKIRAKLEKPLACDNTKGNLGFTCTATIVHKSQIHVDHWDGDRHNNSEENIKYLCANCHTYKTVLFEDYKNRYNHRSMLNETNDWTMLPKLHQNTQSQIKHEKAIFNSLFTYE